MTGRLKLVLASGSPRRLALLGQIGVEPDRILPVSIDETPKKNEPPRNLAKRLAREKAEAAMKAMAIEPELRHKALLLFSAVYGAVQLRRDWDAGAPSLRVGLIQPNVAQDRKWNQALAGQLFQRHLRLTEQVAAQGADLAVWPESSVPYSFDKGVQIRDRLHALAREGDLAVLVGTNRAAPAEGNPTGGDYNSLVLYTPEAGPGGAYDKVHLVPYGEYVPLARWLPFIKPLTAAVGNFVPGTDYHVIPFAPGGLGGLVCYESIFPQASRRLAGNGAALLVNGTNDAWFAGSAAPLQHLRHARVRAVETRRYLVRAANTGISGIIDPAGRVRRRTRWDEETVLVGTVTPRTGRTAWVRAGFLFPWVCIMLTLAALAATWRRRERPSPGESR